MKNLYPLLAAWCCTLALSPALAQGLGNFVDAAHFPIDYGADNMAVGGAFHQRLAQTLTVEVGGTLEGVFLPIGCGSNAGNGKITVEIHDVAGGQPGPTVLASRKVAPGEFDSPNARFTFVPIPGALALAAGQQIAVVIERAKGEDCACHQSPVGSDYPGGQGFFEALPNPPGWVPFSTFPGTPDDIPFQLVLS